jgi:hypothetical protein
VKTLTISNASAAPIRVLSITPPTGDLAISIDKPTLPPSGSATITATLRAQSPGIQRGDIRILTDHPKNPGYTIRSFALIKPRKAPR